MKTMDGAFSLASVEEPLDVRLGLPTHMLMIAAGVIG